MDDLMARQCPMCSAAYGEHSLDDLAECMEQVCEMLEFDGFDDEPSWWPTRRVETVTGPTMARVL